MKKLLTNYFEFNRTEQRGIIVLLIIILMLVIALILLPWMFNEKSNRDHADFLKEAREFAAYRDSNDQFSAEEDDYEEYLIKKLKPFPFDPNDLPEHKWKALGLEDWQIRIIKNFEKKGGRFREKTDLSEIYGISREEYAILEPYITIRSNDINLKNRNIATLKQELFMFDPNKLDSSGAKRLGLDDRLIRNLMNYRAKGGKFYKKEDFSRLYGMKQDLYATLEPYIIIRDSISMKKPAKGSVVVELNMADTLDLLQIKGIGPGFARRIVNYRNKLGGYYRKEQLLEVYGMDSARYYKMLPQLSLDASHLRKININKVTMKELIKHPYFEFYLAKSIITYRDKKKTIRNLEELKQVEFMYDDVYEKVTPYLTL